MSIKKPTLERIEATFTQEEDTCGRSNETSQSIDLEMIRMDEGPDDYYTVIKTSRWAVNDEAELLDTFRRFKAMIHAAEGNSEPAGPSA